MWKKKVVGGDKKKTRVYKRKDIEIIYNIAENEKKKKRNIKWEKKLIEERKLMLDLWIRGKWIKEEGLGTYKSAENLNTVTINGKRVRLQKVK